MQTGVCQKTIERAADVKSITWMPNSELFLSVEGTSIHSLVRMTFYTRSILSDPLTTAPNRLWTVMLNGALTSPRSGFTMSWLRLMQKGVNVPRRNVVVI